MLVIDEFDKAPTHVTAILKALAEDRQMMLADGRVIVDVDAYGADFDAGKVGSKPSSSSGRVIPLHPDFRMIALANRPGYPFQGNDFYKVVGSVFSAFAVDNLDRESELELLRNYAPDVPEGVLQKLVAAFAELRGLIEEGMLSYPYSTREIVHVVSPF